MIRWKLSLKLGNATAGVADVVSEFHPALKIQYVVVRMKSGARVKVRREDIFKDETIGMIALLAGTKEKTNQLIDLT